MVTIVDNLEQYSLVNAIIKSRSCIIIPILSDTNKHTLFNTVSLLYIYDIQENCDYIIPINHKERLFDLKRIDLTDFLSLDIPYYVFDSKSLIHLFGNGKFLDLQLLFYLKTGNGISFENIHPSSYNFYYRTFHGVLNVNDSIPISCHIKFLQELVKKGLYILEHSKYELREDYIKNYHDVIKAFCDIEKSGIKVDTKIYNKLYPEKMNKPNENSYVFTDYNLYTSTGRPSNTFGGVNFAALNKQDGTRKFLVSRHDNGVLVEFDFDAFHLRLIGNYVGYKFPDNVSVHEYLGKYYFDKTELSDDEYKESKSVSFRLLYGGIDDVFENIPYFNKVKKFINDFWDEALKNKYYITPILGRKIPISLIKGVNKYKLWNYFIQSLETEHNIIKIQKLNEYLFDKETKLVLYTYDSFLFDYNIEDGKEVIKNIVDILEYGDFPVSGCFGENYHNMQIISK